jgi:hypothetical protein
MICYYIMFVAWRIQLPLHSHVCPTLMGFLFVIVVCTEMYGLNIPLLDTVNNPQQSLIIQPLIELFRVANVMHSNISNKL